MFTVLGMLYRSATFVMFDGVHLGGHGLVFSEADIGPHDRPPKVQNLPYRLSVRLKLRLPP